MVFCIGIEPVGQTKDMPDSQEAGAAFILPGWLDQAD